MKRILYGVLLVLTFIFTLGMLEVKAAPPQIPVESTMYKLTTFTRFGNYEYVTVESVPAEDGYVHISVEVGLPAINKVNVNNAVVLTSYNYEPIYNEQIDRSKNRQQYFVTNGNYEATVIFDMLISKSSIDEYHLEYWGSLPQTLSDYQRAFTARYLDDHFLINYSVDEDKLHDQSYALGKQDGLREGIEQGKRISQPQLDEAYDQGYFQAEEDIRQNYYSQSQLEDIVKEEKKKAKEAGFQEGVNSEDRQVNALASIVPSIVGSIWGVIYDFLSIPIMGTNLWELLLMLSGISLIVLIIKMVM